MERPERPSRPEKPNRDHLRNSIRIRRRITSILYGMGSQDSSDSETEDLSVNRRLTSGRRHDSGAPADTAMMRHHSSPPALGLSSPPSRNFHDAIRSEPNNHGVMYAMREYIGLHHKSSYGFSFILRPKNFSYGV
ncbi:uncharacterized protein LOC111059046 [Nilaparvata lugens]|uniref:uncharacterized protein LOC111059046 n=1 Tax=Nilaparvata lugens TaxID=108931 RepID=UPI00193E7493|nr:uncharacterized protein LOC111059046 [Nilaparvata lugens]